MQNLLLIGTLLSAHVLVWLTPGPQFFLIIRNSLVYSRKTGLRTAIGFACGNVVHITYVVTGIALIISHSPLVFSLIKYLGLAYIAYLGIKTILLKSSVVDNETNEHRPDLSTGAAIKLGFLTNILNPMASLFFTSIFAGVFSTNPPGWVIVFLWIAMPLNTLTISSLIAVFFSQKRVKRVYLKFQPILNKSLGATLLVLAALVAFRK